MINFTPGPWHTGAGIADRIVYAVDGYAVANATVYHGKRSHDTQGNARLIAAAPAMLQSLLALTHPNADDTDVDAALALIRDITGE